MEITEKTCTICGISKPLEDFYKRKAKKMVGRKYAMCISCKSAWQKEWAKTPRGKEVLERANKKYKQKLAEQGTSPYLKNKAERQKKDKIYLATDAGRIVHRASSARRRSRVLGAEGSFDTKQWKEILSFYSPDGNCLHCRKQEALTLDHVVPLSKGGRGSISNIQPLCKSCNSSKHDKTIDYRFDRGMFALILETESDI